jgi:hypothetical protein
MLLSTIKKNKPYEPLISAHLQTQARWLPLYPDGYGCIIRLRIIFRKIRWRRSASCCIAGFQSRRSACYHLP